MKTARYVLMAAAIAVLDSCAKETLESTHGGTEMIFTASYVQGDSKTSIQEGGNVLWSPQEEINIFYGKYSQGRFVSMNGTKEAVADFKGTLDISSGATEGGTVTTPYWAVYPYSKDNECDGESVTLTLPSSQISLQGTFADKAFPSVARSNSMSLSFYNVCGGLKFSLSRPDIVSVTFEGNNGESIAGKVKVGFGSNGVPATNVLEGEKSITLTPGGSATFTKGSDYYFTILPVELSSGFKMTFRTTDGKKGVFSKQSSVTVKRSTFAVLTSPDAGVTVWEDDPIPAAYKSGLYLGICGFNQALYNYPISKVTSDNKVDFTDFINSLSAKNGTVLYYAVDRSLDALKQVSYPADIANVAVVTFTDGLDQGSLMLNPSYSTDEQYLEAINSRLKNETVAGLNLTAYSIGLKGSDVSDITKFRNNLKKLASCDENAFEVSNMSEVKARFEEIAKVASASTYFTYNLSFTIPGQATGTKIRFTFDSVSDAKYSNTYIEGTFNLQNRTLESVNYAGLKEAPATTIQGKVDGIFVTFEFKGVSKPDDSELDLNYIKQWSCAPGSSSWQINSEFDKDTDVDVNVEISRKSAAVMLVLDCSSSLGSQFSTMQSSACSFVSTLYEASRDKYSVESITLSSESMKIYEGRSKTLSATIAPSTALDKTLRWTSSDPSVAVVSESGEVTGKKEGTCKITATAHNGVSASCEVTVIQSVPFEAVDLGLSVKWANCNIGAGVPEDYGDYYAWGETETKTNYDWSTYKWCKGSYDTLTKYNTDSSCGTVDNKTVLEPEDDVAHVKLGGKWRMPTDAEWTELIENCTWKWTMVGGVNGRLVTSKKTGYTDKSIFLPAAGFRGGTDLYRVGSYGDYWSSSLTTGHSGYPWDVSFGSGDVYRSNRTCCSGQSVRPVSE